MRYEKLTIIKWQLQATSEGCYRYITCRSISSSELTSYTTFTTPYVLPLLILWPPIARQSLHGVFIQHMPGIMHSIHTGQSYHTVPTSASKEAWRLWVKISCGVYYIQLIIAVWRHRSGSGNGLLPGGTKLLPEPMLTYHQWGLSSIHLWEISQEVFNVSILAMSSTITNPWSQQHITGTNSIGTGRVDQ